MRGKAHVRPVLPVLEPVRAGSHPKPPSRRISLQAGAGDSHSSLTVLPVGLQHLRHPFVLAIMHHDGPRARLRGEEQWGRAAGAGVAVYESRAWIAICKGKSIALVARQTTRRGGV